MLKKPCLKVQNLQYIFGLKNDPSSPLPLSFHLIVSSANIFAGKKTNTFVIILPVQEDWRIVVGHEIPEIKSTQTNIFLCSIFTNCIF